jgi:hypothetical protein
VTNKTGDSSTGQGEPAYYLDSRTVNVTQLVEPQDSVVGGRRFVRIEVTQVENPKQYPVSFQVRYQSGNEAPTDLGSFSLFPPDNPGSFIVATQGKVRPGGSIVLSLLVPEGFDSRDTLRVAVKRLRFVNQ